MSEHLTTSSRVTLSCSNRTRLQCPPSRVGKHMTHGIAATTATNASARVLSEHRRSSSEEFNLFARSRLPLVRSHSLFQRQQSPQSYGSSPSSGQSTMATPSFSKKTSVELPLRAHRGVVIDLLDKSRGCDSFYSIAPDQGELGHQSSAPGRPPDGYFIP